MVVHFGAERYQGDACKLSLESLLASRVSELVVVVPWSGSFDVGYGAVPLGEEDGQVVLVLLVHVDVVDHPAVEDGLDLVAGYADVVIPGLLVLAVVSAGWAVGLAERVGRGKVVLLEVGVEVYSSPVFRLWFPFVSDVRRGDVARGGVGVDEEHVDRVGLGVEAEVVPVGLAYVVGC